jgi:high affinity Mn2+ porin
MHRAFLLFPALLVSCVLLSAQEQPPVSLTVSGQFNSVTQGSFNFHSPYSGVNSLPGNGQLASSRVMTLFSSLTLPASTDIEIDIESAGGSGIGNALGLAAYVNLDVVRNPSLGSKPYLARALLHHSFLLQNQRQRVDVYVGQFSTVDWFDVNPVGSDSHTQFLNWAIDNNAAYDYAADTRGYTRGVVVQWAIEKWELRAAEAMMPTVANGLILTWSANTHAENFELEHHTSLAGHDGSITLLSFVNHADMGNYREAVTDSTPSAPPDITLHRHPGSVKYGFGINLQQALTHDVRVFARLGWNEGQHESFAYTEGNNTIAGGGDVRYLRKFKTGFAAATGGISADHKAYLAAGGLGFLLGDGRLRYGRETVLESYTTYSFPKGISASIDLQFIANPGYNRDRGPVWVPALRLHWDLPKFQKNV